MRIGASGLVALSLMVGAGVARGQSVPPPPPPPGYGAPVVAGPDMTQLFMQLTDQPATHSGVVFDKTALGIAQSMLATGGMDQKRAAAAITGISIDNYRYPQPAFYTPEAMRALIDGYRVAGWKHMVNANQTPANTAQPREMATDLWLHFSGADIDGLTVLTRASQAMTVIHLTGDLRPLDLLHLGGHFGIPRVDPNAVMVPAP